MTCAIGHSDIKLPVIFGSFEQLVLYVCLSTLTDVNCSVLPDTVGTQKVRSIVSCSLVILSQMKSIHPISCLYPPVIQECYPSPIKIKTHSLIRKGVSPLFLPSGVSSTGILPCLFCKS